MTMPSLGSWLWPDADQQRQPQAVPLLDLSNPLTAGLCAFIHPYGIWTANGTVTRTINNSGAALTTTASETSNAQTPAVNAALGGNYTLLWTGSVPTTTGNSGLAYLGAAGSTTGSLLSGAAYLWQAGSGGPYNKNVIYCGYFNGSSVEDNNFPFTPVAGKVFTVVGAGIPGTSVICAINGKLVSPSQTATANTRPSNSAVTTLVAGAIGNSSINGASNTNLCVFWDRALSAAEIASLSANPWQLFQAALPGLPVPAGAPAVPVPSPWTDLPVGHGRPPVGDLTWLQVPLASDNVTSFASQTWEAPPGRNLRTHEYAGLEYVQDPPLPDNVTSFASCGTDLPWGRLADRRWDHTGQQRTPLAADNIVSFASAAYDVPAGRDLKRPDYHGVQAVPTAVDNALSLAAVVTDVPPGHDLKRPDYRGTQTAPTPADNGLSLTSRSADLPPPGRTAQLARHDFSGTWAGPLAAAYVLPVVALPQVGVPRGRAVDPRWLYAGAQAGPAAADNGLSLAAQAWVVPAGRLADPRWTYAGLQGAPLPGPNGLSAAATGTALPPAGAAIQLARHAFTGAQLAPLPGNVVPSALAAALAVTGLPPVARRADRRDDYAGFQGAPRPGPNDVSAGRTATDGAPVSRSGTLVRYDFTGFQAAPPVSPLEAPVTPLPWTDAPRGLRADPRWSYAGWSAAPAAASSLTSFGNFVSAVPAGRDPRRYDAGGTQAGPVGPARPLGAGVAVTGLAPVRRSRHQVAGWQGWTVPALSHAYPPLPQTDVPATGRGVQWSRYAFGGAQAAPPAASVYSTGFVVQVVAQTRTADVRAQGRTVQVVAQTRTADVRAQGRTVEVVAQGRMADVRRTT